MNTPITTYEGAIAHNVTGMFIFDGPLLEFAESYIMDENNPVDRRAYLARKCCEAYGEDPPTGTDEVVATNYRDSIKELFE